MAPRIKLFFREPEIDTNEPIVRGLAPVEGFEVEIVGSMKEADAWDSSFAARLLEFDSGPPRVSIPAFPNRKFRQSYIYVNTSAGIETPKDLAGKRIAVRGWANTAGVWARGALTHHHGVDLSGVRWVCRRRDETMFPEGAANIEHAVADPAGRLPTLDEMLLSGAVDAVIDADVPPSITRRDPRARRLFRDSMEEEKRYFRASGIFPISHLVTLRRDFVDRHPEAPLALLKAFRAARDLAFNAIEGSDPRVVVLSWARQLLDEQRALMGESYFSYEVARNRLPLEAMTRYAREQWITQRLIGVDELFDPSTLNDADD